MTAGVNSATFTPPKVVQGLADKKNSEKDSSMVGLVEFLAIYLLQANKAIKDQDTFFN